MKADFSYTTGSDGFTSVYPDTPQAEREYNRIFAETGGVRLSPWEFDTFRQNAIGADYSVKEHEASVSETSTEGLARLLG